jgi:hypothetical protein
MSAGSLGSFVLLVGLIAPHQTTAPAPASASITPEAGTYLGLLFAPSTNDQKATDTPPGVLVTFVLPNSPASKAGLSRDDLLQRYDGQAITGCEQLARLIQGDKPGHVVKLQVLRAGRAVTCEATLTLGPAISVASEARPMDPAGGEPAATSKPGGPALSATVVPQADGRLRVDLQYYQEGTGRLRSLTLTGDLTELQEQVGKLPDGERPLAQVLLDRLKQRNSTPARPRP